MVRERTMLGWIKCDVDAGFFQETNTTSAACCFRNCDGQFVLAHISWKKSVLTVIEGEGVALSEAIKLAILKGGQVVQHCHGLRWHWVWSEELTGTEVQNVFEPVQL
ncbi:unnamed protein product [Trifolium pratense]|uniref:Uncharacterized protein n=1 Tax=Trifolium pratense TaxID=57577 RepID=A0ACB0JPJ0_TRIPR|nr:unnamed protein product [Trifolium pratense]